MEPEAINESLWSNITATIATLH